MRVKVRKINHEGRAATKAERAKLETYTGTLSVREDRMHRFGRTVLTATLTNPTDESPHPILEIHDVVLLWIGEAKMRLRGFEMSGLIEVAQVWEIEIL